MFLCLGEKLAFQELYEHASLLKCPNIEVIYAWLLSAKGMELLHWMVEMYYTTYKSVVKLFLSDELEKLLEREYKVISLKVQRCKGAKVSKDWGKSRKIEETGQTLIVFPDLWTMHNSEMIEGEWVVMLTAMQSDNQKDIRRWEVKKWVKSVIICTYAAMFQDFDELKKIIFVDPHKWYYASQQDPRYKVGEVLKKMAEIYGAELETVGI